MNTFLFRSAFDPDRIIPNKESEQTGLELLRKLSNKLSALECQSDTKVKSKPLKFSSNPNKTFNTGEEEEKDFVHVPKRSGTDVVD